ncbi:MAG: guanine deaminase [Bacteriovorax sp.]|jgi:guanine deaminase|nr:guanine deaminase [Bacteriovorax sp.]
MQSKISAIRSSALSFVNDPFLVGAEASYHYENDALILMENGKIKSFGSYEKLKSSIPAGVELKTYKDSLVLPGFIDTHIHYPQTQIIGAYGKQLIDWLNNYTFVAEQQFNNFDYAYEVAQFFLDECLKAGTTTVMTYCTVHPESVDAFFEAALKKKMRVIAGKVLMDRNAPPELLDTAKKGYDQSKALIKKWHGVDRLLYAITPRFAPTSTEEQLESAGALWSEFPGTYMQSHLSENLGEISWVKELFPKTRDYLDVYDHYKLLGTRAVYGHGIHLSEREWIRLNETGTSLAHCPTSNEFLGSGLFDFLKAKKKERPIKVGLATDIGAGTSFSQLQSMNESYKIAQLSGFTLSSMHAFYLATRGAAEALCLEDKIGSIAEGMEADLVVLNLKSTPLIDFRMKHCKSLEESLFIQMTLGDDRATSAVYIAGELAYHK